MEVIKRGTVNVSEDGDIEMDGWVIDPPMPLEQAMLAILYYVADSMSKQVRINHLSDEPAANTRPI